LGNRGKAKRLDLAECQMINQIQTGDPGIGLASQKTQGIDSPCMAVAPLKHLGCMHGAEHLLGYSLHELLNVGITQRLACMHRHLGNNNAVLQRQAAD
jgi:hypothetical protein